MTGPAYKRKQIPAVARTLVAQRETQRCARCAGQGWQWHHRRSRRVVEPHRHCPCNGLWLCHTCHRFLHKNPETAMRLGFIVNSWETEPASIPVQTVWGWRYHTCTGGFEWVNPEPAALYVEAATLRKERST